MPFQIIRQDLTRVRADAIVNTANPRPVVGRGTDSAVYDAAGRERLLEARKRIGEILPGRCASTDAFGLDAKYIIHTAGPAWIDGEHQEREILRSCYAESLALAAELRCRSIAFPLISAGTYGFPKDEALSIALSEIGKFLLTHDMDVILAVFNPEVFALSGELFSHIEEYIDEHYVQEQHEREYGFRAPSAGPSEPRAARASYACAPPPAEKRRRGIKWPSLRRSAGKESFAPEKDAAPDEALFEAGASFSGAAAGADALFAPEALADSAIRPDGLEKVLDSREDTFQQRLLHLIDESGMNDVTVYKKANLDRKLFSHIRSNRDYRPKKKTALALAIALELDLKTTEDLLSRAELALSPSSKSDLIISYFIQNGIYDIYEINAALFQYQQPTLGC